MKIILVLLLPLSIFAHKLVVSAAYEDGELFVESFFSNAKPCVECGFSIEHKGKEIFEAKLDKGGTFEQNVDLQTPFILNVDGGIGHLAKVEIEGNEFDTKEEKVEDDLATSVSSISDKQIKKIVRTELNKQTQKIETLLEEK